MSSFLTSSKGSKTTPVNGLSVAPFDAQTTNPVETFPRRIERERVLGDEETEENRGPRLSPWALNKAKAGEALSNIFLSNSRWKEKGFENFFDFEDDERI